jgi:DNA-binding CsgD family transcriptional regulator
LGSPAQVVRDRRTRRSSERLGQRPVALWRPEPATARVTAGALPLVGRADAESLLRSVLAAVADGGGDCVIVEGPAGIGKSRILAQAAAGAGRLGLTVAAGRATELDRVAPLTTLLAALSGCEPPVFRNGDLAGLRQHDDSRFWLVEKLATLVEAYSHDQPLVISLDDVQWADELTALALRVLVPALRSSPVLWLLARRPLPARSPAQQAMNWLVAEGTRELPLGPLPEPAVAELCATVLGAVPGPSLVELTKGSGGNPFLLESLLAALRDGDRIRIRDGVATAADGELPAGFLTAVDQRLHDLSGAARRLLEAGSVLGRPFTLHEAAGTLGVQAVSLLDPAKEAVEAATLVDSGTAFAFRHDLIREAIYGGLSGPARQALHRSAASVLQTEGRPAPEVAEHGRSDAKRDAARVQRRLRGVGMRAAGARGGRRPKTGWASLTDSELRVARLVAEGHTNRQVADRLFLSPHTVDSHMRHAFAKLGVSSRVELTRVALANDRPRRHE